MSKLILNLVDVIIIKSLCASSCIRPSHFLTNTVCPVPPLQLLPISNTPYGVASLSMLTVSVTIVVLFFYYYFFYGTGLLALCPTPNRQAGEPGDNSLSAFYPLTSSALAGPTRSKRLQPTYMQLQGSLRHANCPTMIRW